MAYKKGTYNNLDEKVVKPIIDSESLYIKTGMILLKDLNNRQFYYYRKKGILIPLDQMHINKTYVAGDTIPDHNIKISGLAKQGNINLLNARDAQEVFEALEGIPECNKWNIGVRTWKISGVADYVYDAVVREIENVLRSMEEDS